MSKCLNITVGAGHFLTIEEVDRVSRGEATLSLSQNKDFRQNIQNGANILADKLKEEGYIYGVTTGYGENCTRTVPIDLIHELPLHLSRFHGCGLGEFLSPSQTRAVLAVRLASLVYGVSGVTFELLERLEMLLQEDILPMIPSEGSVGASGDLTPLSYVVTALVGERKVIYQEKIRSTKDVFKELEIAPYTLRPKEALALMNGTAVMTALAVEAYCRAEYLMKLSARLTAMTSLALQGNPHHFDEVLFAAKPHPGQISVAAYIRSDLIQAPSNGLGDRIQDRYSTRCAPHVIGVLADMLSPLRPLLKQRLIQPMTIPSLMSLKNASFMEGIFMGGILPLSWIV